MESEKVFRSKRFSYLLWIAGGLFGVAIVGLIGYQAYRAITRTRNVQNVVNVEPDARIDIKWEIGRFEAISGTDYLMAGALSKQTYEASYYEKDASAVRNYLFVNTADKSARWLVDHGKNLFINAEKLGSPESDRSTASEPLRKDPVRFVKYEFIPSDTNADGRLTALDRRSLGVSGASGEGFVEVIKDIEEILGHDYRGGDQMTFLYRTSAGAFISEVDLPSRSVTSTRELPPVPH